jgi:hypothetical protein
MQVSKFLYIPEEMKRERLDSNIYIIRPVGLIFHGGLNNIFRTEETL